ncbi:MAG: YfhO family protein [Oscillospiraceae bacterium]
MGFTYDYLLANHQFEQTTKKDRILLKGLLLEDEAYEKYNYLLPTIDDISVKSLSDQAFLQDCDILAKNASSDFRYDKDSFACTITSDKPNLAFFSIPYEEGFSATVNGKEVEILKANIGFMAVEIPAGTSTIQFNYKTPGLKAGALISIISAIILILYVIIIKKLSKNWVYKSTDEDIMFANDFVLSENTTDDTEEIQAENPPENDNLS